MTNPRPQPIALSLIFSFRNEEETLSELIRRTRAVLHQEQSKGILSSYELIFVNDASSDKSLEILKELAQGHQDIRILNMARCFGVSPCVLAGMEYSTGDTVIYMDADLQDPPELIPEMLEVFLKDRDVDVVNTVRKSRKGETFIKIIVTKIGYWVLNKLASIQLPMQAGDFKLLSRRAVNHLIQLKEQNPFLRGLVCWIGFKQSFVYYHRDVRFAGKTKFHVFHPKVISNFFGSALISFSSIPLRIASYLGIFSILVDFVVMGHALSEKIQGKAIPGWTALMIVILFFGGVQLFCLGIIGLYLDSVHQQSRGRPNYIVDSTWGFPKETFVKTHI